jgi:carbamoyltransferase
MMPNMSLVRAYRSRLQASNADIAAAAQTLLEQKVLGFLGDFSHLLQGRDVVLSGGVFANVLLNKRLASLGMRRLFVCPPMGDEGLSIGAAHAVADRLPDSRGDKFDGAGLCNESGRIERRSQSMYLGPTPASMEETRLELESARLQFLDQTHDVHVRNVADLVADGATVGIYAGRDEFGPRALGNRSILAAASDVATAARLNSRLARTETMPFAPVLRVECLRELFDTGEISDVLSDSLPYMTACLPLERHAREQYPAVAHIDGTARPQVVVRGQFLWSLLDDLERRHGINLLINTSFNVHEDPIVHSIGDAVTTALIAGIDYLSIHGRFLMATSDNRGLAHLLRRERNRSLHSAERIQALRRHKDFEAAAPKGDDRA